MEWFPSKFLTLEKPSNPYALIILNQALNWNAFRVIAKNGKTDTQVSPQFCQIN